MKSLRSITKASALAITAALGFSCQQQPDPDPVRARPALPKLEMRPMLDELRAIAATLAAPEEKVQRELREYADIALGLVESDSRTASMVERTLLAHEDAWFVLEPALTHEDANVRQRAAWLCGQSGQAVLQVPLLLRLKYELDPVGQIWVADALLKLGNDTGLMWLASAFGRQETANQAGQMAIEALQKRNVEIPEEPSWQDLGMLLQEQSKNWQRNGKSAHEVSLPSDQKQLVARLAKHLQTPEGTQLRPVDDARFILTRLGQVGVPMICKTLQADEHYLRSMPLQVLAELGSAAASATESIIPLLGDPLTAMYAVRALGAIGAKSTLPHLRPMLADRDTELRTEATKALGLLGDTESRDLLEARLNDRNESVDVRVGAAFGLLCLGNHPGALAYLDEREAKKDYHEPTLMRLREQLAARAE